MGVDSLHALDFLPASLALFPPLDTLLSKYAKAGVANPAHLQFLARLETTTAPVDEALHGFVQRRGDEGNVGEVHRQEDGG